MTSTPDQIENTQAANGGEQKADSSTMLASGWAGTLETFGRLIALAVVFIGFGLMVPNWAFFSFPNAENIMLQSAVYALAGLGATMVIITGGIDLSAGSTIALAMVCTAITLDAGAGDGGYLETYPILWPVVALVAGCLAGAVVGAANGIFITGLGLVPFIVTLGTLQAIRGLAKGVADNTNVVPPDQWINELMFPVQGRVFSWQLFPSGVWLTLIMALLAAGLLRYTRLGRHIFAIGSNENTARLCGVPVVRTKILVYAMAGGFAGLAGLLEFAKLGIGQPTGAAMYELYIIAACVIGGASLMGGQGSILGTVTGALIIGTLYSGAQQAGWPKWVQEIVIGGIIIAAVALDQLRRRRRSSV